MTVDLLGPAWLGVLDRSEDVSADILAIEKAAEKPAGTAGGATR
jgi:hypothetical protein